MQQDLTELLFAQQFSATTYIAADIEDKIHTRIDVLKAAAKIITPELVANPAKIRAYLKDRISFQLLFKAGVVVADRHGQAIVDYPVVPGRAQASYSGFSCFHDALKGQDYSLCKPVIGRFTPKPLVPIAVPVRAVGGEVIAVLMAFSVLSDSSLFGQVERLSFGKTGYIVVIAPKFGLIVTSSNPEQILRPMPKQGGNPLVDKFAAGYEGSGITLNARGIEVLTSAKWVPSAGWYVQAILPTDEAFLPVREKEKLSYALAAAFSLLVTVLTWLLIRRTLRPLRKSTAAIHNMVAGKVKLHELPEAGGDEVGLLLESFNCLVAQRQKLEHAFSGVLEHAPIGMALLSLDCRFIQVNRVLCEILGYSSDELLGLSSWDIAHPEDKKVDHNFIDRIRNSEGKRYETEERYIHKDGHVVWVQLSGSMLNDGRGEAQQVIMQVQDINPRKELERRLENQAHTDSLTGLANRGYFLELAEQELVRSRRYVRPLAIAMIDLDHFKVVNDTYGHQTGDKVLKAFANVCRGILREVDVFGRVGGEEFAILFPETEGARALEVAERLREAIAATEVAIPQGLPIRFTASFGVVTYNNSDANLDQLLNRADEALYQAKKSGRNRTCEAQA